MKREWAVLIFALLFPSAAAAVYFIALAGAPTSEGGNRAMQIVYGASKIIQFGLPIVYLGFVEPNAFRTLRLNFRGVALGVAFGLLVAVSIVALANMLAPTLLSDMPAQVKRKVGELGVGKPGRFLALATFLSVFHSFLEEFYWRSFVHHRLRRLLPFWPAAIISGLGFMGHHVFVLYDYLPGHFLTAVVPFSLGIAVGGVVWAWLFDRTNSLAAPWISHLLVDVALMYVGYRMVFGA